MINEAINCWTAFKIESIQILFKLIPCILVNVYGILMLNSRCFKPDCWDQPDQQTLASFLFYFIFLVCDWQDALSFLLRGSCLP